MALIHNAWIGALNGIYLAAPQVPVTDMQNFVIYAHRVYTAIHKHHTEEDEFVYI